MKLLHRLCLFLYFYRCSNTKTDLADIRWLQAQHSPLSRLPRGQGWLESLFYPFSPKDGINLCGTPPSTRSASERSDPWKCETFCDKLRVKGCPSPWCGSRWPPVGRLQPPQPPAARRAPTPQPPCTWWPTRQWNPNEIGDCDEWQVPCSDCYVSEPWRKEATESGWFQTTQSPKSCQTHSNKNDATLNVKLNRENTFTYLSESCLPSQLLSLLLHRREQRSLTGVRRGPQKGPGLEGFISQRSKTVRKALRWPCPLGSYQVLEFPV